MTLNDIPRTVRTVEPLQPADADGNKPTEPVTPLRPKPATDKAYLDYWISALEKAAGMPTTSSASFHIKGALKEATLTLTPKTGDLALFQQAGGSSHTYQDVAHWLKVRRAIGNDAGALPAAAQRYWVGTLQQGITPAQNRSTDDWKTHLRNSQEKAADNTKLSDAQLQVLIDNPLWALPYVRCSGHKHDTVAAAQVANAAAPGGKGSDAKDESPDAESSAVHASPLPRAAAVKPKHGTEHSNHMVGATAMGASLVTPLAYAGAALSAGVSGFTQEIQARYQNHREGKAQRLQVEATQAVAGFSQQCHALINDPTFKPLLKKLETAVSGKDFTGDQGALYDAMVASGGEHKLSQQLKTLLQNNPQLETRYAHVHAAFDRVLDTWGRCARANAAVDQRWLPSEESIKAFKTAAQTIPPDGRREQALVRQAEAAIKRLLEVVQRLFQRPTSSTQQAPAPGG